MPRLLRVVKSRRTILPCIFSIVITVFIFRMVHRKINDDGYYLTLVSAYCFTGTPPTDYIEDEYINEALNIQQCSLQNIDACQHINNQTLLFRVHWSAGFASEFNNLVRIFLYAIQNQRRFLIDGDSWNYGRFSSFFNTTQGRFSPWLPLSSHCLQRQFIHLIQYKRNQSESLPPHFVLARDTSYGYVHVGPIAKSWEKTSKILSMKRIAADYLWKTLNNNTKQAMLRYLDDIQASNISYAIHVRRGDKVIEAENIATKKYIKGLEYFMKKDTRPLTSYRIYVASDDPAVFDELRRLRPRWQFVQLTSKAMPPGGHNQTVFDGLPTSVKLQLTHVLIAEMEILSRVKYVVCTFSSNVCRLVQILRKQDPDTVLSLDEKWHPQ